LTTPIQHPSLQDVLLFSLWIWKTKQSYVGEAMTAALTSHMTTLFEAYVVHVIGIAEAPAMKCLMGRSGTRLRNIDAANKLAWLKKLKFADFHRGRVLKSQTGEFVPEKQQDNEPGTRYFLHIEKMKTAFANVPIMHIAFDASMHHEDTLVSAVYSPESGISGCPSIMVAAKVPVSDLIMKLHQQLAAENKLKKKSAYGYLKVLTNKHCPQTDNNAVT
jgi:hypothetical protein